MISYNKLKKELIPISAPIVKRREYKFAAVLVPIFTTEGKVLLTKRSNALRHHKGQIAFPGGKYEVEDKTLLETCLRETEEEVGIRREKIKIVGRMNPVSTTTKNCVYPFVGLINEEVTIKINEEVESYFFVSFEDLMNPRNQRIGFFQGGLRLYYLINNYKIWGVTRKILSDLVKKLKKIKETD